MPRIAPTAIPAIVAGGMLDDVVCVGNEEFQLVVVDDGVDPAVEDGDVFVDDGVDPVVEDGDVLLRQLALSEGLTVSMEEHPPVLPRASVTVKMIEVPAATLIILVKLVPVGGEGRKKKSPPGMNP